MTGRTQFEIYGNRHKPIIDTKPYETVHGRKPRGKGRYVFAASPNDYENTIEMEYMYWSRARRVVRKFFRDRPPVLYVLPGTVRVNCLESSSAVS